MIEQNKNFRSTNDHTDLLSSLCICNSS